MKLFDHMILHIAILELRRIFVSPLAWAVLAIVQVIMSVVFFMALVEFVDNRAQIDPGIGVSDVVAGGLFSIATIVFLMVLPLLTMRLFSEERSHGSLDLLLSSPATATEIVLGKYLGLVGFICVLILLLGLLPLSLLPVTNLDLGRVSAGFLGLFLLLCAFGAAGTYMSSLTSQPAIAAISSFGLLLLLWLINWVGYQDSKMSALFSYLSLVSHYDSMVRGIFNSSDVIYYALFSALFLGLTVQRVDMYRR